MSATDPPPPDQQPDQQPEPQPEPQPAPDPQRSAAAAPAPVPGSQRPGPPGRSRRQTAWDMIRSLAVILAVVGVVLLFAPQPGPIDQPQVEDTDAVLAVDEATLMLGGPPLLLRPASETSPPDVARLVELEPDWRLDYARTELTDEVGTWRVGVLSPDERRVDLEQAVDPTEEWLVRDDDGDAGLPEPVQVDDLTWTRQVRGDGRTVYTYVDQATGLTTAVSGTGDSADLQEVVGLVSGSLSG